LNFFVNPQVLIPRPETELLVEESLKILSAWSGRRTVVELGTGSGAVSIALIKSLNRPGSVRFLATDISRGALKTARKNAAFHGLDQTIGLVQGDWLKPFASGRKWIDLLISNPPYISESEMSRLPATVRRFEPAPALLAGPDGLAAIRSILAQAAGQLKPGGRLILEIGETQGREVLDLAHGYRFVQTAILKDYSGKDRLLTACCHG
jgi:release factor glutamine methyltransferase